MGLWDSHTEGRVGVILDMSVKQHHFLVSYFQNHRPFKIMTSEVRAVCFRLPFHRDCVKCGNGHQEVSYHVYVVWSYIQHCIVIVYLLSIYREKMQSCQMGQDIEPCPGSSPPSQKCRINRVCHATLCLRRAFVQCGHAGQINGPQVALWF